MRKKKDEMLMKRKKDEIIMRRMIDDMLLERKKKKSKPFYGCKCQKSQEDELEDDPDILDSKEKIRFKYNNLVKRAKRKTQRALQSARGSPSKRFHLENNGITLDIQQ